MHSSHSAQEFPQRLKILEKYYIPLDRLSDKQCIDAALDVLKRVQTDPILRDPLSSIYSERVFTFGRKWIHKIVPPSNYYVYHKVHLTEKGFGVRERYEHSNYYETIPFDQLTRRRMGRCLQANPDFNESLITLFADLNLVKMSDLMRIKDRTNSSCLEALVHPPKAEQDAVDPAQIDTVCRRLLGDG